MALPVIDYEPIAMQLPEAHLHVTDGLHPQVNAHPVGEEGFARMCNINRI